MPKVEIYFSDLKKLISKEVSLSEVEELLSYAKCEVEEVEGDVIKVESKDSNRPDLWSVEGIARIIKGILGVENGIPKYYTQDSGKKVIVDNNIRFIRPYIACAIVKDVNLGEEGYHSLIQLQDKVMQTYGRKRKKVAIGTSNLDLIEFPVYYKAVKPEEIKFVPLYGEKEMTLKEILEKTEKGKEYGWILREFSFYPILVDNKNEVISFPPIINSNTVGRISPETKNIFVDVTGTDWEAVLTSLNVMVTALADRGGKIEKVEVVYLDKSVKTPMLEAKSISLDLNKVRKLLGVDISNEKVEELLKKMRYDVERIDKDVLKVSYLNYRSDIFSWRDVFEDVCIAYGYNNIPYKKLEVSTVGKLKTETNFLRIIRDIMVGLKFIEVHTPVLMSKSFLNLLDLECIELENPVSENYDSIRPYIFPNILEAFVYNKKEELPLQLFEVGLTARKKRDDPEESYNLAFGIMDTKTTLNQIREAIEFIFTNLGVKYRVEQENYSFFVPGRSGKIVVEGAGIGFFGEVHPKILENLDLYYPVSICEINISKILKFVF